MREFGVAGIEGSPAAPASAVVDGDVSGAAASVQLPYRMVFAVATMSSVVLYDSQVCTLTSDGRTLGKTYGQFVRQTYTV